MNRHRVDSLPQEKPAKRSRLVSSDDSDDETDIKTPVQKKKDIKLNKQARLVSSDDDSDEDRLEIDEGVSTAKSSPVSKTTKRSRVVASDDSDEEEVEEKEEEEEVEEKEEPEEEEEEEVDDTQSEIFDVIVKPPKKTLKRQTPFDFSDEEEDEENQVESESVVMAANESASHHDQSLHLVLSSDSPSDADVTMKEGATTENDDPEDTTEDDRMEDNASNFKKDSTNNATNDNAENYLDNKPMEESDAAEGVEDNEEEGEWEEICDDGEHGDVMHYVEGRNLMICQNVLDIHVMPDICEKLKLKILSF